MKQNQQEGWLYEGPQIQVIGIDPYSCLLDISGAGGHNKAGDDGNDINDAKQGWFDDEEDTIED